MNVVSFLLLFHTVFWCYTSYFEMHINRINRNRVIPVFSAIAALVFLIIINIRLDSVLLGIACAMVSGMAANLIMILLFLNKNKIFSNTDFIDEAV